MPSTHCNEDDRRTEKNMNATLRQRLVVQKNEANYLHSEEISLKHEVKIPDTLLNKKQIANLQTESELLKHKVEVIEEQKSSQGMKISELESQNIEFKEVITEVQLNVVELNRFNFLIKNLAINN